MNEIESHKLVRKYKKRNSRRTSTLSTRKKYPGLDDYWIVSLYANVYQYAYGLLPMTSMADYFSGVFEIDRVKYIVFHELREETLSYLNNLYKK